MSMYRQSGKLVKQQYLFHMSLQYGELGSLMAEIDWWVWGTSANFNGFRVLASLLKQRRLAEVNQILHNVWPSPGLVHYIYIFAPNGILPGAKFTLRPSLKLRYPILAALPHGTRAVGVSQTLQRGIFTRQAAIQFDIGRSNCLEFFT